MQTICDTLLYQARTDAASPATGTTDALAALHRLTQLSNPPDRLTVSGEADGTAARIGVPEALLKRIVSPLLANALRYARTRVVMCTVRESDHIRIDVPDALACLSASAASCSSPPAAPTRTTATPERASACHSRGAWPAPPGGEVTHDADYTPGARFVISLPPG
ncbi:hypothetical protein ACFVY1_43700 [Streptomyces sp. NPDC058293]|uniref:hypothetical protein n=1 Tax=Streptomyces sp. NPDC058293 TaxID=3346429 RepID=UPI0036EC3343